MRLQMQFEDHPDEYRALQLARLLCDLQHITIFSYALALDEIKSDDMLFSPRRQKYEFMILADETGSYFRELGPVLYLEYVSLSSPLTLILKVYRKHVEHRMRRVAETVFHQIIMGDLRRERFSVGTYKELQDGIAQALQNYDKVLEVAEKIPDEKQRQRFVENMSTAIAPFVDGRHPPIKTIEIDESWDEPRRKS